MSLIVILLLWPGHSGTVRLSTAICKRDHHEHGGYLTLRYAILVHTCRRRSYTPPVSQPPRCVASTFRYRLASTVYAHPILTLTMQPMRALAMCLGLLCVLPAVLSLTVHLVPHTHDDVGWLKTVDQYFIGSNDTLQHASVNNLITATLAALKRVPERKFIYVEQAFFQRWWRQQSDDTKSDVKKLVSNGQLEFINGGWCMHDEASRHIILI